LRSIKNQNIELPIFIADDSKVPYKDNILKEFSDLNIKYFNMPFNSGVSKGRNLLLSNIDTKYFILCDDDFYFDKETNFELAKKKLKEKNVDILGGMIFDYRTVRNERDRLIRKLQASLKLGIPRNYIGEINIENNSIITKYDSNFNYEFKLSDMVLNFFLAKTDVVKKIGGWDDSLKSGEHTEFFIRAKLNDCKVGYTKKLKARHYPLKLKEYSKFREDKGDFYTKKILNKYNARKWIAIKNDGTKLVMKLENDSLKKEYYNKNRITNKINKIVDLLKAKFQ
jgi:glycosyltransferase involved in cell wall biosynthesis